MEDDTGITTTMSSGTCTDAGSRLSCGFTPRPDAVYSVGAVFTDLPAPYEELTDDNLRGLLAR
jgi:hypothetical protein